MVGLEDWQREQGKNRRDPWMGSTVSLGLSESLKTVFHHREDHSIADAAAPEYGVNDGKQAVQLDLQGDLAMSGSSGLTI